MSFIPIMEVSKNGTEALEKKEEVRITVEQEVIQSEGQKEIEGTRSTIAKQSSRKKRTPAIPGLPVAAYRLLLASLLIVLEPLHPCRPFFRFDTAGQGPSSCGVEVPAPL